MPYGSNFSFVIDSSFQPFTLQEMLVPFAAYKEAFEKSEEDYMKLTNEADKFKYLSETLPEDSKARQLYEGYANGLRAQAEDLAHNGLTMGNRRALTDYKRRYQGEIGRIADAQERKRAQWDEQRKMLLQNPTMMYSRRADLTSLDDYLDNPDLSYESYNGALLSQQVSTAASAIAKSLRDYGHGKPLDKFTSTWLQQHGFTAAEVAAAINDPTNPNSSKILNGIVEQAIQSSGIPRWADKATMDQAYAYARQGLWSAVGETKVDKFENYGAKLAAEEASKRRLAAYESSLRRQEAQDNGRRMPSAAFDRRPVGTTREIEQDKKNRDMFEKYSKYFYKTKDGNIMINYEGRKLYEQAVKGSLKGGSSSRELVINPNTGETLKLDPVGNNPAVTKEGSVGREFREWVDSMGWSQMATGKTGPSQSASYERAKSRAHNTGDYSNGAFDQIIGSEYYSTIDPSEYKKVSAKLNFASTDQELTTYTRDKDNGSDRYVFKAGKKVQVPADSDIVSATAVFGIHGNYVEVRTSKGDTYMFKISDISPSQDNQIKGHMARAAKAQQMEIENGGRPLWLEDQGMTTSEMIERSLEAAQKSAVAALGVSKSKDDEVEVSLY